MFQNNEYQFGKRFLKEALPLISSYFSGESVRLANISVSIATPPETDDTEFIQYIRFRHAIACCAQFIPIVQKIENGLSSVASLTRTETKGVIRGRLDVPRYVARKSNSFSWPKSYPILVNTESASTPENELVVRIFRTLLQRLPLLQFPVNSAETLLGRRYKSWVLSRLKRAPWSSISSTSSLSRLYMESCRRVARRQTGNEKAYLSLIKFIKDWHLVGETFSSPESSDKFVDAFLSFPAEQYFLDRIYEIWCIYSISDAFSKIGGKLVAGPCKLTESKKKPIYTFSMESNEFEIWFQTPLPSEEAEWFYDSTASSLRGIPDITIIANKKHRLIIDAKNRMVSGTTRSEETYKMLGYFENFKKSIGKTTDWGILAFVSLNGFSRSIRARNGRSLELISANPALLSDCNFSEKIELILRSWINNINGGDTNTPKD